MKYRFDPMTRGIVLLSTLVLVESMQLAIVLGWIASKIPVGPNAFNADLFAVFQSQLKPNHQMLIYHLFIVAALVSQFAVIRLFRPKLSGASFQAAIKKLLWVDSCWVLLQTMAIFKTIVYGNAGWAWDLFYICLMGAVLSKVFWIEISRFLPVDILDFHFNISFKGEHGWRCAFILIESTQVLIAANFLLGHASPVLLYGVFLIGVAAFLWLSRIPRAADRAFITVEGIITYFLVSALFKMVIYDYRNQLAVNAYHLLLIIAVLNKFFWHRLWSSLQGIYAFLVRLEHRKILKGLGDCLMVGLIIGIIYLPDPQAVLAKIFVGEQFHHMNHFVMAPAYAYASGCTLDVDVISRYGLGAPIVLATLAKWMGGVNYLNILLSIMWICIAYYILAYFFLRMWLKSFVLAAAGILIGIKLQMFYTLTLPQPLTYASGTPVRFIWDIAFMFAIWFHLRTEQRIYLWLAAASCAVGLFYMMETGLYLTATLGAYLFLRALMDRRILKEDVFCFLAVPVGAFLLYGLEAGGHVWTQAFWLNTVEYTRYFTGGMITGLVWGDLQYAEYWNVLVGFFFPLIYVLTILIIGTLCVVEKISKKHLMVIVWCIYGLGAHHYYITLPTANNYYMRALPFVFVCLYWARWGMCGINRRMRQGLGATLIMLSVYALWTNHHFLSYPNMFNFSKNPMVDPLVAEELPDRKPYLFHKVWDTPENQKLALNSVGTKDEGLRRDFTSDEELKTYYKQESSFPQDAGLIRSLTSPSEKIAIISSFEIDMLMQADRRPLFYYFSLFFSRPMAMRNFGTVDIYAHAQLERTINQLEQGKIPYVFMERIFLNRHVPPDYAHDNPGLMGLLDYVNTHYTPYRYGKYLVALKRHE